MARIFITGSSDGLGLLAVQMLVQKGHSVVLHARNSARRNDAKARLPEAEAVLVGDLSDIEETKRLAHAVNDLGQFDAIIHNAGVYQTSPATIFSVNTLAPYILTAMIKVPERLIYISSGMHRQGSHNLISQSLEKGVSYSDSKLLVLMLAFAAARRWPEACVNTVDPGWVPTKMGGRSAPDDLNEGAATQVWLASAEDARVTGRYFFHRKEDRHSEKADATGMQDLLIRRCEEISGVKWEG